ncbi:TPA: DNA phosphorothioation-dependent restriction protein DptG [Bacillus cereus]|nr:DNA phosphorothioation-dependent restriction protein DptG [Bacillus cereus]
MSIENLMNEKIREHGLEGIVSIKDYKINWLEHGWEYKIPKVLNDFHRRVLGDIFPFSPYAIKREEMWASVISGLLEQSAEIKVNSQLIENLLESKTLSYRGDSGELKDNLKAIFEDLYYIESKSSRNVPFILPFHLEVIGNLKTKEPRGFNQLFKLLLTDETGQFNDELFNNVLLLFSDRDSLTPIDKLFIRTLRDQPNYKEINSKFKVSYLEMLNGYNFYKKQGELFRRDLKRILEMKVSRIEKVRYFSTVMGLHFSIYVIRISYYLDWEFKAFFSALESEDHNFPTTDDYDKKFKSKITFTFEGVRTPKSSKPVVDCDEMSQVVYRSYIHMVLLNTIRNMSQNQSITLLEFKKELNRNKPFNKWVNLCFDLLMLAYVEKVIKLKNDQEIQEYLKALPGRNTFKRYEQLVIKHFASQKSQNRTPRTAGIQFIKQSMGFGFNYSFIASKPGIGDYYGVNKDLIILLAHLTIDIDEKKIRYKDFLSRISSYGFNPDQHAEESLLQKLEETGLLQKFSDSGEAMYVRTIF